MSKCFEKKNTIITKVVVSTIFIFWVLWGFCDAARSINKRPLSYTRESVIEYFQNINNRETFIDIYGGVQRILGKRQIEEYTIFKNSYDKLVQPRSALTEEKINAKIKEIEPLFIYLNEKNIPYLFIEPPLPIAEEADLPYYFIDHTHGNAEKLHALLSQNTTINATFDLTKMRNVDKEDLFYRTDHHWSGDTAFEAYMSIQKWLKNQEQIETMFDHSDFQRISVDGFLGSYGIKVGKYYDETDDYIYYRPSFDTDFDYTMCDAEGNAIGHLTGSWDETLICQDILNNSKYYNKYNAMLWGNGYPNHIVNNEISNGRLLIVSHSYGRPLTSYLALNYHEVYQVDPQEGRYNGDYLDLIDEYQPDTVLFIIEFEGEIIGEYKMER